MNVEFGFNTEYLKECFKRRKKPEERIYPKKDWPVGYEPTKKEHEEWMEEGTGVPVSFRWEDIGGGRKRGVFTPIKKNIKILTDSEKVLGNGQPVNFQIENTDGKLIEVSKEEFVNWTENGKNVKTIPKESLVYGIRGNIDGLTYFTERKGKDGVIKESYHEPRSEEEKKQIIERNRKRREQEKSQHENSPSSDKKEQKSEQERNLAANQEILSQNNKETNQNIYYGVGLVSLVILLISMVVVRMNKKK